MGQDSAIEWTDHTFNPWIGCQKVSPGCDHCYAERLATQRLSVAWETGRRITERTGMLHVGKRLAGALLDGREHRAVPHA
jgi:protein gp37